MLYGTAKAASLRFHIVAPPDLLPMCGTSDDKLNLVPVQFAGRLSAPFICKDCAAKMHITPLHPSIATSKAARL